MEMGGRDAVLAAGARRPDPPRAPGLSLRMCSAAAQLFWEMYFAVEGTGLL